ncbi:MAG: efflux RND transporter periplasmic adaptor subunit [Terriglobia bacterium]
MRFSAIGIIALILSLYGCEKGETPNSSSKAPVPGKPASRNGNIIKFDANSPQLKRIGVTVVELFEVPIDEISAPGKVEWNPGRVSRVVLPVSGRVNKVFVGLGDAVREGQPLLTVESPDVSAMQSSLRQAEANISQSTAAVAKAEADLARVQDLLANRAIAQKDVLAAETALAQARAVLEQARASRDDAQRKLHLLGLDTGNRDQVVTVCATLPGKIVDVSIAAGEYRNDTSAPVLTIADLNTVWVSADVPESAIRLISIGEPVLITLSAYPDRRFSGRVKRIGDVVDPQTRTIKVRAELDNSQGLFRPEMFATIRHSHGTRNALVVPMAAIFQEEGRSTLFRERSPGEFERMSVAIFWQDDKRAAIESGLHLADRVVVDGLAQLRAY